jgi:hypothetical protein
MSQIGAVLTGDIIHSTKYSVDERKLIRETINLISKKLRQEESSSTIAPFPIHIFSGDSWQFLLTAPEKSLRMGLLIRAMLRSNGQIHGVDTRFGIGIGEVVVSQGIISYGDGEAFILSGRSLTTRGKRKNVNMVVTLSDALAFPPAVSASMRTVLELIDFIATRWTEKQALAVSGALKGWGSEAIATAWTGGKAISPRMVNEHLVKAGWDAVQSGMEVFEENISSHLSILPE